MGYYTYHKLYTEKSNEKLDNELYDMFNEDDDWNWNLAEFNDKPLHEESSKWYDSEKDMRELSKKYPTILFKLKGEGEESGDVWIEYYKDGKMQRCQAQLVFDEFEESKLK